MNSFNNIRNYLRDNLKKENGFTLTEVLVILLIMGILAGMIITIFPGRQEKSEADAAVVKLDTIAVQLENYATQNNGFENFTFDIAKDLVTDVNLVSTTPASFDEFQLIPSTGCNNLPTSVSDELPTDPSVLATQCQEIITCNPSYYGEDNGLCLSIAIIPLGIESNSKLTRVKSLYTGDVNNLTVDPQTPPTTDNSWPKIEKP